MDKPRRSPKSLLGAAGSDVVDAVDVVLKNGTPEDIAETLRVMRNHYLNMLADFADYITHNDEEMRELGALVKQLKDSQ